MLYPGGIKLESKLKAILNSDGSSPAALGVANPCPFR